MAVWYARNILNADGTWGSGNFLTKLGPQIAASGSLGVLSGASTGLVEQPVTNYYTASIRNADGTAVPNGVRVHLHDRSGLQEKEFPNGLLTTNHPAGHPIYPTTETGWISFTHFDIPSDQVNHHISIFPQPSINLESGVSIEISPQVTSNGNG